MLAFVLAVILAAPAGAVDCDDCNYGCYLDTDALALLEAYADDRGAFRERATRCREWDPNWDEIYANLEKSDPRPPDDGKVTYKQKTELERRMLAIHVRIRSCMLTCGAERFQKECVGGPSGMSCECFPEALSFCRAQANSDAIQILLPGYVPGSAGRASSGSPETDQVGPEDPPSDEISTEDAHYLIEVRVSAEGFEGSTVYAPCGFEPSSVTVHGRVVDDSGIPVPGARVELAGLGATMRTNDRGQYLLSVATEGDRPFDAVRDVMIVRLVRDFGASVKPLGTVWANGREFEAELTVTAEGRPLAGKEVSLSDWGGFERNGRVVAHVTMRRGNNLSLRLDEDGRARFRFEAPVLLRRWAVSEEPPETLFPIEGHFRIKLRSQDAAATCSYRVESPFPRIARVRLPGPVDAGLWQVPPSSLVIEDPDSTRFTVTVRGRGDFRTTQPGAAAKAGVLVREIEGSSFEFSNRPPPSGIDPTAMPDVLDQFMNTSKNIYIGVATNVVGGMLVDKVQVAFPNDGFGNAVSKMGLELDAGKLLDAGGNMANIVNLGSATYVDSMAVAEDRGNGHKQLLAGGNLLVGAVDTSMGFAGTLSTTQGKLAWEGAKAYWEYLKLVSSVSDQYHELAESYQDTALHPIRISVEDESGHRTTVTRVLAVRVWKGGSQ